MHAYKNLKSYFGDLHNHCGISYGHGTLDEAIANAKERLDFCSVTGHAHWPDMPEKDDKIQYIIDFHREGFSKLKQKWPDVLSTMREQNTPGKFVTFPGFEVHSFADGDYTVIFKNDGDILYEESIPAMQEKIRTLCSEGTHVLAFPHHIGYRLGARGINWANFAPDVSPVVELVSMHGASETCEGPRPYLHTMGPCDFDCSIRAGLEAGHVFGFVGSTDHHSAHPGSYGHGFTGVWSKELTRESLWEAIRARRTYALTGDKMQIEFSINDNPMGSVIKARERALKIKTEAGGSIDYIDIVKNNRLFKRFSQCDMPGGEDSEEISTRIYFEVGWGQRKKEVDWEVSLELESGEIISVEPRFRGQEVVSPVEKEKGSSCDYHNAHWERTGEKSAAFTAKTTGNPNNFTQAGQGICLNVKMRQNTNVIANVNGKKVAVPLNRLLKGSFAGDMGWHSAPSFVFHRAPRPEEFNWAIELHDTRRERERDYYYVRVRQKNEQWAWSSPIWVE